MRRDDALGVTLVLSVAGLLMLVRLSETLVPVPAIIEGYPRVFGIGEDAAFDIDAGPLHISRASQRSTRGRDLALSNLLSACAFPSCY